MCSPAVSAHVRARTLWQGRWGTVPKGVRGGKKGGEVPKRVGGGDGGEGEGGEVAIPLLGEPWKPMDTCGQLHYFVHARSASLEPCGVRMKDVN